MTIKGQVMNAELRMKIVETVFAGKHGHIPSAFSIIDILEVLYRDHLKFDPKNPDWPENILQAEYQQALETYETMKADERSPLQIITTNRVASQPVLTKGLTQVALGAAAWGLLGEERMAEGLLLLWPMGAPVLTVSEPKA